MTDKISQGDWNRIRPVLRKEAIDSGMSAQETDLRLASLDDPTVRDAVLSQKGDKRDPENDSDGGNFFPLTTLAMSTAALGVVGLAKVAKKIFG